MASKTKGFVKMMCATCLQRLDLTESQTDSLMNGATHKELASLMSWHYSQLETKQTDSCCECNPPLPLKKREHDGEREIREREEDTTEFDRLNKKWSEGIEGSSKQIEYASRTYVSGPDSLLSYLGIDDGTIPPVKIDKATGLPAVILYCSFCKTELNRVTMTEGISNIAVSTEYKQMTQPEPVIYKEVKKVSVRQVKACPDCAHLIKPLMHTPKGMSKPEIKHQGTIAPRTEG